MPPITKKPKDAPEDPREDPQEDDAQEVREPQSHPFYCPGCGRRWNYPTECRGASESAPHAPIEVVSTDELDGDPEKLTAAPDTSV